MVTRITRFKDEVSGKTFATIEDAKVSEARSTEIKDAFRFYVPIDDAGGDFADGVWCIQRTEAFYNRLLDTLRQLVEKYEPWIVERCMETTGSFSNNDIRGYSFLGRYLDDGNSDLHAWWHIQSRICPVCFREHGQTYYATHCTHDDQIITGHMKEE